MQLPPLPWAFFGFFYGRSGETFEDCIPMRFCYKITKKHDLNTIVWIKYLKRQGIAILKDWSKDHLGYWGGPCGSLRIYSIWFTGAEMPLGVFYHNWMLQLLGQICCKLFPKKTSGHPGPKFMTIAFNVWYRLPLQILDGQKSGRWTVFCAASVHLSL